MIKEISKFNFHGNEISIIVLKGEPWFAVSDLRNALGIRRDSELMRSLKKGLVKNHLLTKGGKQGAYFCSEKDMYKITLRSRSEVAEPFVDWVCGEVLPSIRKTGAYRKPSRLPAESLPAPLRPEKRIDELWWDVLKSLSRFKERMERELKKPGWV